LKIIDQLKINLNDLIPIPEFCLDIDDKIDPDSAGGPDFLACVSYNNQKFELAGEILYQKYLPVFKDKIIKLESYIEQRQGVYGLIVSPYLSKNRRIECKSQNINYIDLSGNVFINLKGLYIEREGFPNLFPEQRKGRSPFSDKASLVLRAMMLEKEKIWGIRQLAGKVDLNPGFVSRLVQELEERKYGVRSNSKIKLIAPKFILSDWLRDYNYKKNREYKFFCLAESPEQIIDRLRSLNIPDKRNYVLSFHAGANLIAPYAVFNEVHIYIKDHEDIKFFKESLNLMEAEQGSNVILAIPFYKHSAFYQKQKVKDLWVASDLQLYLDLYHYPLRGIEQAEYLYEKKLKPIIEA